MEFWEKPRKGEREIFRANNMSEPLLKYNLSAITNLDDRSRSFLAKAKHFIFRRNKDNSVSVLTNDQNILNTLSSQESYDLAIWLLTTHRN